MLILVASESVPGATLGGLIILAPRRSLEVCTSACAVGGGIEGWFYVLALLFLLVRPEGLPGRSIIDRV